MNLGGSIALFLIVQFGTAVVPIVFDIEFAIVFVLSVKLFQTVDDVDGANLVARVAYEIN